MPATQITPVAPTKAEQIKVALVAQMTRAGWSIVRVPNRDLATNYAVPSKWPSGTNTLAVVFGAGRQIEEPSSTKSAQAKKQTYEIGVVVFVADADPATIDTTLDAAEASVLADINALAHDPTVTQSEKRLNWVSSVPVTVGVQGEASTYAAREIRSRATIVE